MTKNIYIIRHCKAEGQVPDAPLTEEGFIQAKELAKSLSDLKVDRIISSPFVRAIQTIKPFAENKDIDIEVDSRLAERVLSTAFLTDWMEKLEATFNDTDLKFEGGESSNEAAKRIVEVIDEIVVSGTEDTVIVSHGGIISLLLNYYDKSFGFEQWMSIRNPDVYHLKVTETGANFNRLLKD
ncbi:phosphoserine phosphatase 2 [Oceanobacillus picturae]|uniref:Phosphoserine phosphatase 2 n=1 Tax=Oceanobacillus picturae TaxID=171693 RepID=A0A0U9H8D0_9BACI|nr:histidine phosphatase family protein [Oceanobacillus picturae]GAQ18256.1 phosphoserine phosphatase 2 [Oceanobacillus picturae]